MELTADQQLRKDLLIVALDKQPDFELAVAMAAQMERFVLEGHKEGGAPTSPGPAGESKAESAPEAPCAVEPVLVAGRFGSGSTKRRWSEADGLRLTELWYSPASLEEIASALGRTTPSLYSRARALGLPRRAQSAEVHHEVTHQPPSASVEISAAASSGVDSRRSNGQDLAIVETNARRAELKLERYRSGRKRPNHTRRNKNVVHLSLAAVEAAKRTGNEISVDPIIQFLRSRDYSIVRVSEGRFKLDGRRILSADELREKANQVRQTLGQPPFVGQAAEPVN